MPTPGQPQTTEPPDRRYQCSAAAQRVRAARDELKGSKIYETAAILAMVVFCYSILSDRLETAIIGGAVTFTAAGLVLGPQGLGVLDLTLNFGALSVLAELTLALLLFSDAATADLRELVRSQVLPRRLLLVGLPLTILLGAGVGVLLFDALSVIEIALLATILAPTDAALGKAVVTDERVPNRIRTSLNFESGLNDGICVPIFLALLALATHSAGDRNLGEIALKLIVEEIGIGVVVGLAVVGVAVILSRALARPEMISPAWRLLPTPALALACFCTAQALGGSGFIAAFVGGLLFGGLFDRERKATLLVAAEGIGGLAALLTWVLFGATVAGQVIGKFDWTVLLYAALSLTLVRMLPVFLCLRRTEVSTSEALFIGWFGPRGLASIVFTIMAIEASVPGAEFISTVAACTILMSVLGHGLTARPFAGLVARKQPGLEPPATPDTVKPTEVK
jgi:NhaP-type Na+/H+ or K+/H+ antiporter